jgi:SAM-dependent methyltransferase
MQPVNYNEISKIYDDVRAGDLDLINAFLRELPPADGLAVLDIGCGTANYTHLLQRVTQPHAYRVYGLEPSEGMLAKARQKNHEITFWQSSADSIPAEDAFFDFIYMTDVIHHVPDIRRMFAEIRRVLKPGGKVCILTQSHQQIGLRPIVRFFPGTARVDCARYPDIPAIQAAGQQAGLSFIKTDVSAGAPLTLGADYLELVRKKGYSMLHLIEDDEYQSGLRQLEKAMQNGPIQAQAAGETLVWFAG